MNDNPWLFESIQEFTCLKCPEQKCKNLWSESKDWSRPKLVHTIKTDQTSSPVHDGIKPFTCSVYVLFDEKF